VRLGSTFPLARFADHEQAHGKSGQAFPQRFGVHEVRRRETLSVRAVDGREGAAGLVAAALL